MRSLLRTTLLLALAVPSFSQSMLDHAAAASGAILGTTAGKGVSNGITAIFGGLNDATAHAAAQEPEKSKPHPPAAARPLALAASAAPAGHTGQSRRQPARPSILYIRPAPGASVAEARAKEPALDELLSVKIGARQADLTALGSPSSTISIPEDGHLFEVLRYSANGHLLGTVRLDNGEVVEVNLAM